MTDERTTRLLGLALVGLWLVGCGPADTGTARPDILLITIDTARVDRFSFMGPSPVETSIIDSLADEAIVFTQAICPAPLTLVSHASLFTGQLPITHGIRNNGAYRLRESATTLAELLAARGYRTGAFVGATVLDSKFGLDQGFEHYDDQMDTKAGNTHYAERPAAVIVERALHWLATIDDAPSFVWVHFFDPHYPWAPPPPEKGRFLLNPYDGEIAYVDRQVGVLIDGYRAIHRWQDAWVALAADHGESLNEHGEASHGVFLYDVTMRVPLLLRIPGRPPAVVSEQVQLVDLLPTFASGLGLQLPGGIDGRDLTPLFEGDSAGQVPVAYLESFLPLESFGWSPLRGLRDGRWKLVVGVGDELYDLASDPGEEQNLASREPQRLVRMKRQLQAYRNRETTSAERVQADEETLEAIRSLGYFGASSSASDTAFEPAIDPRRHVRRLQNLSAAADRFERGFVDEALEDLRREREGQPGNPWIHELSVELLQIAGRTVEAEEVCRRFLVQAEIQGAVPRRCASVSQTETAAPQGHNFRAGVAVAALLVDAERLAGQQDEAAVKRVLTEITRQHGGGEPARLPLAERMRLAEAANRVSGRCWDNGDFSNAAHGYSLALEWMPEDARIHYNLGLAWERYGVLDKALAAHQRALELDPQLSSAARHRDLIATQLDEWQM